MTRSICHVQSLSVYAATFYVFRFPYKRKPFLDYFNKLLCISHLVLNNLSEAKLFTTMIKKFNLFN